jgi:demethylmenaquinone methyltransferase/2-methoxy-6-polyprenyl-1,4-benzoquinol methylase
MEEHAGIRKDEVGQMFDDIAGKYDLLNHLLSLGIDRLWRRRAIKIIGSNIQNPAILDVATGTGDLAIASLSINPCRVTGIDISGKMLEAGREKLRKQGLASRIELAYGASENIDFSENNFNVVMSAFGVRNFSDTLKGLTEMHRVLAPSGMIMILEFSKPEVFPLKQLYLFYFRRVLPFLGRIVSGSRRAYSYLPESVMKFPDNQDFLELLIEAGFKKVAQVKLSGGIVSIYTGFKD